MLLGVMGARVTHGTEGIGLGTTPRGGSQPKQGDLQVFKLSCRTEDSLSEHREVPIATLSPTPSNPRPEGSISHTRLERRCNLNVQLPPLQGKQAGGSVVVEAGAGSDKDGTGDAPATPTLTGRGPLGSGGSGDLLAGDAPAEVGGTGPEGGDGTATRDAAAIKIQSLFRGQAVRRTQAKEAAAIKAKQSAVDAVPASSTYLSLISEGDAPASPTPPTPRPEGSTPGVGSGDLLAGDAPAEVGAREAKAAVVRSSLNSDEDIKLSGRGAACSSHYPNGAPESRRGRNPHTPRSGEAIYHNIGDDSGEEDAEARGDAEVRFAIFAQYEALGSGQQKSKLLEGKLTKTELDASGSNDGEVGTGEENTEEVFELIGTLGIKPGVSFLLEKRMILHILSTHFDQEKLAPFSIDLERKGLKKNYESLKYNVEELRGFINSTEYEEKTKPRITLENILQLIENSDDEDGGCYEQIRRPQRLGYNECCNSVIRYLGNILDTLTYYIYMPSEIIREEIDEDMMKRAQKEIQDSLTKKNIEMQRYQQTFSKSHKKLGRFKKILEEAEAHLAQQNQVNTIISGTIQGSDISNEAKVYLDAKSNEQIMTIKHNINTIKQLIHNLQNDTDKVEEEKRALELSILELQNHLYNPQPICKQVREQIEKPYMDYASSARKELEALIVINQLSIQDA